MWAAPEMPSFRVLLNAQVEPEVFFFELYVF